MLIVGRNTIRLPALKILSIMLLSKQYINYLHVLSARGSVVGWGTMLQAGKPRIRFSMKSLILFNLPNPSIRNMVLRSTQPLTEMRTRKIPGGKGRPAHKADNLTAICEPTVWKMWEPRPLTPPWAFCYRVSFTFFSFTITDILSASVSVSSANWN
jgi:hypothetical protein